MNRFLFLIILFVGIQACSTVKKIVEMNENRLAPILAPVEDIKPQELGLEASNIDTAKIVEVFGTQMYMMHEGEMLASSIKIASFKNVAERQGRIDLKFRIIVPSQMLCDKFQIRIVPNLEILENRMDLDSIFLTGKEYRRTQLRGYQRYERFLKIIITDTTVFIRKRDLEIFLARNIPQLYALRSDSTFVSDEHFSSIYGVREQEAVWHYTDKLRRKANLWRMSKKEDRFRKYVKSPVLVDGIRLDTVYSANGDNMVYEYVQTISAAPKLKKANITLSGSIYEEDRMVYSIPKTDPLTFYISSLSTLVDNTPRYLVKVISRHVHESSSYAILFEQGQSILKPEVENNEHQLEMIEHRLRDITDDIDYDVDSVIVTASASPEGRFSYNRTLSGMRGEAICARFRKDYKLRFGVLAENWTLLDELVRKDNYLSESEKENYFFLQGEIINEDDREKALSEKSYYRYLREALYPKLRLVKMDFYLTRKDMVKDTIHTLELDTVYMNSVQLIRDREYKKAIVGLREARDFNTAICYASLDYNESALDVLKDLDASPKVCYLMAVLEYRKGDEKSALTHYMKACEMDKTFIHRGNLDPEISNLINKYKIKTDLL